jgi:cytochrome c-type biogenesis protein CcmE
VKRLTLIADAGVVLSLASALVLGAMRDSIVFSHSPSEVLAGKVVQGVQARVGGMVENGSVERSAEGLDVRFRVTDNATAVTVAYRGILPDLFREGQGVIVEGRWQGDRFDATTVLAKHDENYMPREVAGIMKPQVADRQP